MPYPTIVRNIFKGYAAIFSIDSSSFLTCPLLHLLFVSHCNHLPFVCHDTHLTFVAPICPLCFVAPICPSALCVSWHSSCAAFLKPFSRNLWLVLLFGILFSALFLVCLGGAVPTIASVPSCRESGLVIQLQLYRQ